LTLASPALPGVPVGTGKEEKPPNTEPFPPKAGVVVAAPNNGCEGLFSLSPPANASPPKLSLIPKADAFPPKAESGDLSAATFEASPPKVAEALPPPKTDAFLLDEEAPKKADEVVLPNADVLGVVGEAPSPRELVVPKVGALSFFAGVDADVAFEASPPKVLEALLFPKIDAFLLLPGRVATGRATRIDWPQGGMHRHGW